jgi:hypothetical protein
LGTSKKYSLVALFFFFFLPIIKMQNEKKLVDGQEQELTIASLIVVLPQGAFTPCGRCVLAATRLQEELRQRIALINRPIV